MKYEVIVCDPPWGFDDGLRKMRRRVKRSAAEHYPTMTVSEIAALDVPSLVNPEGCVLALWTPGSFLESAIDVYRTWGFSLRQTWIWVKTKNRKLKVEELVDPHNHLAFGMGRLMRQSHELALICVAGKSVYPMLEDHSQRSVGFYPRLNHSTKPPNLHVSLEKMFPSTNKLELFARRQVQGWTCVGNEIDGKDIRDAIQSLKAL